MRHSRITIGIGLALLLLLCASGISGAATINEYYVSVTGSNANGTGTAAKPWKTIQYAVNQIWKPNVTLHVLPGTYKERVVVQAVAAGLRLLGAGSAVTTIDASDVADNGGVIKLLGGTGYVISGFMLTGGTYEGLGSPGGAIRGADVDGWDESSVSARVENNFITGNFSWGYRNCGGAVSLGPNCAIVNNTFLNNLARYGSGAVYVGAHSTITRNLFMGNTAEERPGGAVEAADETVVISQNVFRNNRQLDGSAGGGGAFYGKANVHHNIFVGNSAAGFNTGSGGAAHLTGGSFVNNTVVGNIGDPRGAASGVRVDGPATIVNNIIVNGVDGVGLYVQTGVVVQAHHNNLWNNDLGPYGGAATPGAHDLHSDPRFVNLALRNFRLKSVAGHWGGSAWVLDAATSPCLDAGDSTYDFTKEPAPNGGCINMGYDGNTIYASKSAPPVAAWSPKGTSVSASALVTVTFSTAMNRSTVREAMSINGVNASVFGGTFAWYGNKIVFNPANDFEANTAYEIAIGTGAKTAVGVPLEEPFAWTFTTRAASAPALTLAAAPTAAGAQLTLNLASAAEVSVSVRNLAGREVAVLSPGTLQAGVQTVLWNGKSRTGTRVPAGLYLVQVSANAADGTRATALTSLQLR